MPPGLPPLRFPKVDRSAGVLLGLAAGDALGAAYEFAEPPEGEAEMRGGGLGGFEPGEWTDDTAQAIAIAESAATGELDPAAVGDRILEWFRAGPPDVGIGTSAVLREGEDGADLPRAATDYFRSHPDRAAGNGSLMRTAPVALAHLGDDDAIAQAATEISALTHGDPQAGHACVLWSIAVDRAVREARLDGIDEGLALLPADVRDRWAGIVADAREQPPSTFRPNGYVVAALQAALSAVTHTPVPGDDPPRHLQDTLHAAVRIGHDTDTVAAIAGALLGARWGASAVPFRWRRKLHGWPGYRDGDLIRLAVLAVRGGRTDAIGWPTAGTVQPHGDGFAVPAPRDPDLLLGDLAGLAGVEDVDAVVSLCRVGSGQVPDGAEHYQVLLIDSPHGNPNLDTVLADAAAAVAAFREEDRRVYLHCAAGASRTPTVAAVYLADRFGLSGEEALAELDDALPYARPNAEFRRAVLRLAADGGARGGGG